MGYREYFLKVKKKNVNKIRKLDYEGLVEFCKNNDVDMSLDEDDFYISVFDLFRKIGANEVFEFGKYYENSEEVKKLGKPLFKDKKAWEIFGEYYDPHIVGKEAVLSAIEWQRNEILTYFKNLSLPDEEYKKLAPFDKRTREERLECALQNKVMEWQGMWGVLPYNLNTDRNVLVRSWLYEYTIFDLVRILHDTNWNTECLIFYGY